MMTRLDDDLRRRLARAVADGQSIRGACRALEVHPSQVSRWRGLDKELRTLLAAASLLRATRVFQAVVEAGRVELDPEPSDPDVATVLEWAETAIYSRKAEARREALDLLRTTLLPGAKVPFLAPELSREIDQAGAAEWDQARG